MCIRDSRYAAQSVEYVVVGFRICKCRRRDFCFRHGWLFLLLFGLNWLFTGCKYTKSAVQIGHEPHFSSLLPYFAGFAARLPPAFAAGFAARFRRPLSPPAFAARLCRPLPPALLRLPLIHTGPCRRAIQRRARRARSRIQNNSTDFTKH